MVCFPDPLDNGLKRQLRARGSKLHGDSGDEGNEARPRTTRAAASEICSAAASSGLESVTPSMFYTVVLLRPPTCGEYGGVLQRKRRIGNRNSAQRRRSSTQ